MTTSRARGIRCGPSLCVLQAKDSPAFWLLARGPHSFSAAAAAFRSTIARRAVLSAEMGRLCRPRALKSPKGGAAHWAAEPKKKDIRFQRMSFFLEGTVKIDILSMTNKTAAQRRHPTASPAQRVAVGKEEQGRGRMTSFWP